MHILATGPLYQRLPGSEGGFMACHLFIPNVEEPYSANHDSESLEKHLIKDIFEHVFLLYRVCDVLKAFGRFD